MSTVTQPLGYEPWITQIPETWKNVRFGDLFKQSARGTNPDKDRLDYYVNGAIPWLKISDLRAGRITEAEFFITETAVQECNLMLYPENTLLISDSGTVACPGILKFPATGSSHLMAFFEPDGLNVEFAYYWVKAYQQAITAIYARTTAQPTIRQEFVKNLRIPTPELETQNRICNYLNSYTEEVDKLIESKKQLIKLLEEKKQSVIYNCVNFGIDGEELVDVAGKLGYEPWVNKVPKSWKKVRLDELFEYSATGATPNKDRLDFYTDGNIPWLKISDLTQERITKSEFFVTKKAVDECKLTLYPVNTFFVSLSGTIARPGLLKFKATTNQHLLALFQPKNFNPEFAFYWFKAFQEEITIYYSRVAAQATIRQDTVKNLHLSLPELQEQNRICKFLNQYTSEIDRLIQLHKKHIELLEERKRTVITDAISGRKKI